MLGRLKPMKKILLILFTGLAFAGRFETIWSRMEFPEESVTPFTFGTRNCGIGDVNGDGYDDFLVNRTYGYYCTDTTAENRVLLFLGRAQPLVEPDLIFAEQITSTGSGGLGLVMNGLGDVNGDGYDDFAICAGHAITDTMPWGDIAYGGKVYVHFGGQMPDTIPDLIFKGNIRPWNSSWEGGGFADAVCGADVNNDGYKDIIIGSASYAPTMEWYDRSRGRVYIFFGGPAVDTTADIIINGGNYYAPFPARYEQLGYAIDNLGDVNGDGYEDIIVGAPNNMERNSAAGKAYLFYGGNPMDTLPDWWYYGEDFLQCLGKVVSDAGDFNGDGYNDIMIGDYRYNNGFNIKGRAIIFYGGSDLDTIPDWQVRGRHMFGSSVDCVGDVQRDGCDDVIVADNFFRMCEEQVGRVLLYNGGKMPDTIPDTKYTGTLGYENNVGWNLCSAGDIDGDGTNEIMFGTNYPPIVPYPGVYGWVRVMKYFETALPESLSITGGDCFVAANWSGEIENETTLYQLLKNDISDTIGWWEVGSLPKNDSAKYVITDYDVEFSKSQYYWLKIYGQGGTFNLYGHYEAAPTPMQIIRFCAYCQGRGYVHLDWLVQGNGILGYNLYREIDNHREKINGALISLDTKEYSDCWGDTQKNYKYWLGIFQTSHDERLVGPISPSGIISAAPNPFHNLVSINYRVSGNTEQQSDITVGIYNILGQKVKTIWQGYRKNGVYEEIWDGKDDMNRPLPAGVYYCIYKESSFVSSTKIVLIK